MVLSRVELLLIVVLRVFIRRVGKRPREHCASCRIRSVRVEGEEEEVQHFKIG